MMRKLTEAEARGTLVLTWSTTIYARETIGAWLNHKTKPTQKEMSGLMRTLMTIENLITDMTDGPTTNGHSLDHLIDDINNKRRLMEDMREAEIAISRE
jgi:hypothetical protein